MWWTVVYQLIVSPIQNIIIPSLGIFCKEYIKNFRVLFDKMHLNPFSDKVWKIIKITLVLLW